jgi:hypothetical protein
MIHFMTHHLPGLAQKSLTHQRSLLLARVIADRKKHFVFLIAHGNFDGVLANQCGVAIHGSISSKAVVKTPAAEYGLDREAIAALICAGVGWGDLLAHLCDLNLCLDRLHIGPDQVAVSRAKVSAFHGPAGLPLDCKGQCGTELGISVSAVRKVSYRRVHLLRERFTFRNSQPKKVRFEFHVVITSNNERSVNIIW